MESVLGISYGQLMLMKNFRPRAFQINSFEALNINRKYIVARFGLTANIAIDLINLHFDSSYEQRANVLEYLFNTMNTQNYMIIGDLNFGDEDIIEEDIIQKSKYQIRDLWKEIYDLDKV
jgi:endonuclease/exonuclease/phosphatase family metal-dependent hydrolase